MSEKDKQRKIILKKHQRTSIGKSTNTKPKNKNKRKQFKRYRRQGK